MRKFNVLILQDKKRPLAYPLVEGEQALQTMETLAKRGHSVVAVTEANGIKEQLSLEEMRDIYA